jgi:hypothetical protein
MDSTGEHIADEMWRELRDDVVRKWERLMDVTPEVTDSSVKLHSFYGSLNVRFDPDSGSVHVALRPCCDREDCPTPVMKRDIVYETVVKSGDPRGWRRARYEHRQERMAHLIIYHLLKHRDPA